MRLFYGFDCSPVLEQLKDSQEKIMQLSSKGSQTRWENFHLTLLFLGDVDLQAAKSLGQLFSKHAVISLQLEKLGIFRGSGGNIVWAGLKENKKLQGLAEDLSQQAFRSGLINRVERYTPHITLMRRQAFLPGKSLKDLDQALEAQVFQVENAILYESVLTNRGVVYLEKEKFSLARL